MAKCRLTGFTVYTFKNIMENFETHVGFNMLLLTAKQVIFTLKCHNMIVSLNIKCSLLGISNRMEWPCGHGKCMTAT